MPKASPCMTKTLAWRHKHCKSGKYPHFQNICPLLNETQTSCLGWEASFCISTKSRPNEHPKESFAYGVFFSSMIVQLACFSYMHKSSSNRGKMGFQFKSPFLPNNLVHSVPGFKILASCSITNPAQNTIGISPLRSMSCSAYQKKRHIFHYLQQQQVDVSHVSI